MFSRIRKVMSSEKGFTLVELLVVIGIIGILAMLLLPQFRGMRDRARIASCQSNLKNIGTTLESFYADKERYPDPTEWTNLTAAGGDLENLRVCPQDKSLYIYVPGVVLDTTAVTAVAPIIYNMTITDGSPVGSPAPAMGSVAVAGAVTGTIAAAGTARIDSYLVVCEYHDGSGVDHAATAAEAAKTQLIVTQAGVDRMPK